MTTERLVARLDASGALPETWRAAFLVVPRHRFLPREFWVDDEWGDPQPVSSAEDPDRWLEAAYRDVPILVQFDDGRTRWPDSTGLECTSSASKPTLVLRTATTLWFSSWCAGRNARRWRFVRG